MKVRIIVHFVGKTNFRISAVDQCALIVRLESLPLWALIDNFVNHARSGELEQIATDVVEVHTKLEITHNAESVLLDGFKI